MDSARVIFYSTTTRDRVVRTERKKNKFVNSSLTQYIVMRKSASSISTPISRCVFLQNDRDYETNKICKMYARRVQIRYDFRRQK